jgi:hypothetical protein
MMCLVVRSRGVADLTLDKQILQEVVRKKI